MTSPESSSANHGDHESPWEDIGYDHPFQSEDATLAQEADTRSARRNEKEAARLAVRAASQMIPDRDTGDQAGVTYAPSTPEQLLLSQKRHLAYVESVISRLHTEIEEGEAARLAGTIKPGRLGLLRQRLHEREQEKQAAIQRVNELTPPEQLQEKLF